MTIRRRKTESIITLIIGTFVLLMFFVVSLVGLFSDKGMTEKIMFFVFLGISIMGLYGIYRSLEKMLSGNPVFELSDRSFLIFDDPDFYKIPYNEMLECGLYTIPRATMMGISLKQNSNIKGNSNKFQRLLLNIPKDKSNIVFLGLQFVDIDHDKLVALINKKIAQSNTAKAPNL